MIHNLRVLRLAVLALSVLLVSAPGGWSEPDDAFLLRMDDLDDNPAWFLSNFEIERESFRTAWKRSNITRTEDGGVALGLMPAPDDAQKDFFGAEVQRTRRTHFGRYEVVMTPARGHGVISSFFTYTGPYFGDPHDEIDFEFLGRDTTRVWLNRFVGGENLPGRWIELGFDAAEGAHLYSFDWLPDRLVWSVDGLELLRVTAGETAIPQSPQRIYLNIWAGAAGQRGWSGEAPPDMHAQARYYCVSYRPPGSDAPMCSDETWTDGSGDD